MNREILERALDAVNDARAPLIELSVLTTDEEDQELVRLQELATALLNYLEPPPPMPPEVAPILEDK